MVKFTMISIIMALIGIASISYSEENETGNVLKSAVYADIYMPKGCISESKGCCIITSIEYQNLMEVALRAGAPSVRHEAKCENGQRSVKQEAVWPSANSVKF